MPRSEPPARAKLGEKHCRVIAENGERWRIKIRERRKDSRRCRDIGHEKTRAVWANDFLSGMWNEMAFLLYVSVFLTRTVLPRTVLGRLLSNFPSSPPPPSPSLTTFSI